MTNAWQHQSTTATTAATATATATMAASCRRRRQSIRCWLLSSLLMLLLLLLVPTLAAQVAGEETKENRTKAMQQSNFQDSLHHNFSQVAVNKSLAAPTPASLPSGIRENVMLPSADPEREAQILYEKSLQEYHGSQLSATATATASGNLTSGKHLSPQQPQRTLHTICERWQQKHCHCSGSLESLRLSCRGIGILAVPVNLPSEVIVLWVYIAFFLKFLQTEVIKKLKIIILNYLIII